jgi:hypothetical protein
MRVKKYLSPSDYYFYMNSHAWRNKHYQWLKQCNHRCSMFPIIRIGKYAPKKYGKYNIHHKYNSQFAIRNSLLNCELRIANCELYTVGYQHLGHEELWKDVLPLCPLAHWVIHGGKMKAKAPWRPNIIQKTLHLWCSLPLIFKQLILFGFGLLIPLYFSIWMGLISGVVIFYLLFC